MTTEFSWNAPAGSVVVIDSTGTSGDGGGVDLKNLSTAGYVVAPLITPADPRPLFATYVCKSKLASSTGVSGTTFLKCWFLDKADGTNVISDSGTNVPTTAPDFVIFWPTIANAGPFNLRSSPRFVMRPPWAYKMLIQQNSGQATTNVNNDNILYEVTVDEKGT